VLVTVAVLWYAAGQFFVWSYLLELTPGKSVVTPSLIIQAIGGIVTALGLAVWMISVSRSLLWALLSTLNAVALMVGQFAVWYAAYGTRKNWSVPLTKLDALQLSLGQFTTAGAPGITPRSQAARALMTSQLAVGILAAIVLFGLLVARIAQGQRRGIDAAPDRSVAKVGD